MNAQDENFSMRFVLRIIPLILILVYVVPHSSADTDESILKWSQANYKVTNGTGTAKIIVNDNEKNTLSFFAETVKVFVYSDSLPEGITITLYETETDSGIFERTFSFSDYRSAPSVLQAREGDTMIAIYSDEPLPDDYIYKDIDFTATTLVGNTGPPLERVPASNARITDIHKEPIGFPVVNEQILLTSDIENQQLRNQTFVWIAQVTDNNKKVEAISWINGTLFAESSFSPTTSWIPKKEGHYNAVFFVWESLTNPTALSPPIELDFVVEKERPPTGIVEKEIEIRIGDPIRNDGLVPIITTETTKHTEHLDTITDWHFLPLNHGEWGSSGDNRVSWDILPAKDRLFVLSGTKEGKRTEFETLFFRDGAMRSYAATCQGVKIEVLSAVPTDFEIPKGLSSVSVMLSDAGLLPVDGLYTLQFASFFDHKIFLPENAIVTYSDKKRCSTGLEEYPVAFYDVVVFKLQDYPEDFEFTYSYGVGGKNSYNSNREIHVTDMVCDEPLVTHVPLTQTEMGTIWKSITENDFFMMADFTRNCDANGNCVDVEPESITILYVVAEGIKKSVTHKNSFIGINEESFLRFNTIIEEINQILKEKEELEFLPKPRCGYL